MEQFYQVVGMRLSRPAKSSKSLRLAKTSHAFHEAARGGGGGSWVHV